MLENLWSFIPEGKIVTLFGTCDHVFENLWSFIPKGRALESVIVGTFVDFKKLWSFVRGVAGGVYCWSSCTRFGTSHRVFETRLIVYSRKEDRWKVCSSELKCFQKPWSGKTFSKLSCAFLNLWPFLRERFRIKINTCCYLNT